MTRTLYSGVTTPAASVTVYWAGTTTKPPIYVSATGTTKANPVTADWGGAYSFWIDDGHYKIVNGSTAGDLNDVRISSTPEAKPGADQIAVLPFLGSTATTQQALNEALLAGSLSMVGGTFTGPITTTDATASTSTVTGSIITAGGIGAAKDSFFGGLIEHITANGAKLVLGSASEVITLSTVGDTTYGTSSLIPANAIMLGGAGRVITTITTATDWLLGVDTGAMTLAGPSTDLVAGSTATGIINDWTPGFVANRFKIVTTGTPGAGSIRCVVFYVQIVAPTS